MVKSYYLTKNTIVVRDMEGKTIIYNLDRQNLMNIISDLDKQVNLTEEEIVKKENDAYMYLTKKVSMAFMIQFFLTYASFMGFTHASYISIVLGIVLSIPLLAFTFINIFKDSKDIKTYHRMYQVYEGREILVKKYNSLLGKLEGELVDVY